MATEVLGKWPNEMKAHFNALRAKHNTVKKAMELTYEEFPDEYQYGYVHLAAYARSVEGQRDLQAAYDVVREDVKKHAYAHSGGRIETLIELGHQLLADFRKGGTAPTVRVKLAGEIRDVLKEIRNEVDPYGLESRETRSHFENILLGIGGLPQKQQQMILGATSSKDSTSETKLN